MSKVLKFKKEIQLFLFLIIIYFFSRIYKLTFVPIFTDEAIYIRWSEIALYDASWRFISLTDGKQPLFVWLTTFTLRFFQDPLFAGRIVSVLAGLGTAVGLFLLSYSLFSNRKVAFFTLILYLLYPFALVYDRMALMDSLVGMFAVWALYFEFLLVKTLRLDVALILGMIIGGGILTKSSGFFSIYLLPFTLLLLSWHGKEKTRKFFLWLGLSLVAVFESQLIYSVLRLSPFFHMIGQKNTVFIYPFKEWFSHPWRFFIGNLKGLWDWFITYFSWPVFFLLLFSLFWKFKEYLKEKVLLIVFFAAPFFALALFGKVLYPRFIFFMTLSLLPLVGLVLGRLYKLIEKPFIFLIIFLIFAFSWIKTDFELLTNPYTSSIPESDKFQYFNDWPAGGGIREAVSFFKEKSQSGKIFVATEGTFGPLPYALEVYLYDNPNVKIHGFWPLKKEIPEEVLEAAKTKPTYFVFNQTQTAPPDWPLLFIAKYRKGVGEVFLHLYQVVVD